MAIRPAMARIGQWLAGHRGASFVQGATGSLAHTTQHCIRNSTSSTTQIQRHKVQSSLADANITTNTHNLHICVFVKCQSHTFSTEKQSEKHNGKGTEDTLVAHLLCKQRAGIKRQGVDVSKQTANRVWVLRFEKVGHNTKVLHPE